MLLSFVIPYYNGSRYIDECISSIYNQELQLNEFEVIIINDNSPDKLSVEKLQEYQTIYKNLHIIHNSENQRCGMCRNIGMQSAQGEYIWFVDQDDYIVPNCVNELLNQCFDKQLDILYFDYKHVSDDLLLDEKKNLIVTRSEVTTGLEYIHNYCQGDFWNNQYDTNVWHALYRKSFLITNNIFSPPVSYCEDLIVAQKAIILAQRFLAITDAYYCYRYNPASVFHTQVGKNGRLIFDASIYTGRELVKLSSLVDEKYTNEKLSVLEGGIFRINSFTKSILKKSFVQRNTFFECVNKHKDIFTDVYPYLSPLNKWIVHHQNICRYIPLLVYLVTKLKE